MLKQARRRLKTIFCKQRLDFFPGVAITMAIVSVRALGGFQSFEWMAFDQMLRYRPDEGTDPNIVIVGINNQDIEEIGSYPVPDKQIADLINEINVYEPRVIGLNIFRDLPVAPGTDELVKTFEKTENLVGIDQMLFDSEGLTIDAPPSIPSDRVGFSDLLPDLDGFVRISLLGASDQQDRYRFSFSLLVAELYLLEEGLAIENGIRDPTTMRFGETELRRFYPNSGGYIRADGGGNQVLLNYRSSKRPFHIVSYDQVINKEIYPELLRDKIVLIGTVAKGAGGIVNSKAPKESSYGLMNGISIQAHAISQIVNSVLYDRPLINYLPDFWEYAFIIACSVLGITLGRISRNPFHHIFLLSATCMTLIAVSYVFIVFGFWIPIVPSLLVLSVNGVYLYDRTLRIRIQDRQSVIDQVFDLMHSGPLQLLSSILRNENPEDWTYESMHPKLRCLNEEIRNVYSLAGVEVQRLDSIFPLANNNFLELSRPLHKVFYEIYRETLSREPISLNSIDVKIFKFEPLEEKDLSLEEKRGLCRFLEEALINVDKHADGATRLSVMCCQEDGTNCIQIIDNGKSNYISRKSNGFGSIKANKLAAKLHGDLLQEYVEPHGFKCEIRWKPRI